MRSQSKKHNGLYWFTVIGSLIVLIIGGGVYRAAISEMGTETYNSNHLSVQLSEIAQQIGNWTGKDIPIPKNIQDVARMDDFVNRLYVNSKTSEWANVYIAFTFQPGVMLGHQPDACYTGNGWIHESTQPSEIVSSSGRKITCLIHHFHKPLPENESTVVLNFYVVNGRIINDENYFSGVGWRTPNVSGNPSRYAAQIQISSILESSVRSAAMDITDTILDFLPDKNGKINVAKSISLSGDDIKIAE